MSRTGPKPREEVDLILAVLVSSPLLKGYEWGVLELAEILELDHERVRQIEFQALKKLRTRTKNVTAILREVGLTYDQCRPRVNSNS